MHISIVAILTMASLSALSWLIRQELTRLRQTSPGMEVVEGDKVAVLTVAVDRVVVMVMGIKPTPLASERAMIKLHWLSWSLVVLENIKKSGAWHARLAGGIPPILQDSTIRGPKILMNFPFLLPTYSGLSPERNLPLEVTEAQLPLPQLLSQLLLEALDLLQVHSALALGSSCSVQDRVRGWAIHLFPSQLWKGFKLMGHCTFDWQFNVLTLLLSVFVFRSMANFIHWSLGSGGQLSHWSFGGSQMRKCYNCPRPNHKRSKCWQRWPLLFELITWCCCRPRCCPPW